MEYRKTKKIYTGIVIVDDDKINHVNLCMASTKEHSRDMVKVLCIIECFAQGLRIYIGNINYEKCLNNTLYNKYYD